MALLLSVILETVGFASLFAMDCVMLLMSKIWCKDQWIACVFPEMIPLYGPRKNGNFPRELFKECFRSQFLWFYLFPLFEAVNFKHCPSASDHWHIAGQHGWTLRVRKPCRLQLDTPFNGQNPTLAKSAYWSYPQKWCGSPIFLLSPSTSETALECVPRWLHLLKVIRNSWWILFTWYLVTRSPKTSFLVGKSSESHSTICCHLINHFVTT